LEELRKRQTAVPSTSVSKPTINAPEVEPADKIAFVEAEASQDVKQLLRFIARFPNSSYRSKALFRLGYVYSNGEWGLLVDKPQARHWYRKAVELGSVASMVNLAHLYERGLGGPRDYAEARRLYSKIAESLNVSEKAKRYAEEGLARMSKTR
jgi:TPR repeat protein